MNRRLSFGAALVLLLSGSSSAGPAVGPSKPCPGYEFEPRELSFERYRPPSATIGGVSYPRDGAEAWRGAPRHSWNWTLVLALRAMLGDPYAFVGSRFYSLAQEALSSRGRGQARPWPGAFWLHHVLEDAEKLDACAPFSEADAAAFAADLTRKAFLRLQDAVALDDMLLDETSPNFDWYPDLTLYSTVYRDIAPLYGGKELSFRPAGRGIDRHYWMAAHGRASLDAVRLALPFRREADWRINDAGSVLTPGYIRPEEVTGYAVREAETRDLEAWRSARPRRWGLRLALRKVELRGTSYVVVLDGRGEECVDRGRDGRFRFCRFAPLGPDSKLVRPSPVVDLGRLVPVVAVLAACAPASPCALPPELRAPAGSRAGEGPDADVLNLVKAVSIPGKKVALFSPNGSALDLSGANDCPPGTAWRHASKGERACVRPEIAEEEWLRD